VSTSPFDKWYSSSEVVEVLSWALVSIVDTVAAMGEDDRPFRCFKLAYTPIRPGTLSISTPAVPQPRHIARDRNGELWAESPIKIGEVNYRTGVLKLFEPRPHWLSKENLAVGYTYDP